MALLKAPIYGLDDKLFYGKLGDVIWDGKHLSTEPQRIDKLRSILGPYELTSESGTERFDPGEDPEAWIKNLHRFHKSVELRAYRASEVRPLKPSPANGPRNRWSQGREAR